MYVVKYSGVERRTRNFDFDPGLPRVLGTAVMSVKLAKYNTDFLDPRRVTMCAAVLNARSVRAARTLVLQCCILE